MAEVLGKTRLAARMKSGMASTGQDTPTMKNSGRLTRDEQQNRRLAAPEPGADELRQEADRQHEGNGHEDEIREPSERREAVNARQDDQIEREPRQREAEMRERLAEDGARAAPQLPAPAPPSSKAAPPSDATPSSSVCCRISMKAAGTT